jgi:integrase
VIYYYGLRVEDATRLTVENLDRKNHWIRIRARRRWASPAVEAASSPTTAAGIGAPPRD